MPYKRSNKSIQDSAFKMKGWSPFTKKDDDFTREFSRITWKKVKKHVEAAQDIKKYSEKVKREESKKKRIMTDARLRLRSYKNIGKIIEKKLTK